MHYVYALADSRMEERWNFKIFFLQRASYAEKIRKLLLYEYINVLVLKIQFKLGVSLRIGTECRRKNKENGIENQ